MQLLATIDAILNLGGKMKTYSFFIIFSLFVSTCLYSQETLDYSLAIPHSSDFISYWDQKSEITEDREQIIDWVPKGESLEDSSQSFTTQAYQFEKDFELKAVFDKFFSTLEENIEPKDLLHYEVHYQDLKSMYFEWWVNFPYKNAQHEWIKILKSKDNQLLMVRYSSKSELCDSSDALWVECIKESQFSENQEDALIYPKLEDVKAF